MESICKEAFERFPLGIIFSKTAPNNCDDIGETFIRSVYLYMCCRYDIMSVTRMVELPMIMCMVIFMSDYDKDFCYFYFTSSFEDHIYLKRANMCDGVTNAKRDFVDYKAYFDDDIRVMKEYSDNKVLNICEPWSPPGISSHVYTRKTAMQSQDGRSYMLGCFALIDDVVLGTTAFRRVPYSYNKLLSPSGAIEISPQWFVDALQSLPIGVVILDSNDLVVIQNTHWNELSKDLSVSIINNLFNRYGFATDSNSLLHNAAWITGKDHHDIGVYGIQVYGMEYKVIAIRPSMRSQDIGTAKWVAELK
jgi:hypothetical protein